MQDPKYVRLRADLSRGGRYDVGGSGWGISGYDVKEMPDPVTQPNAYRFVRGEIQAGRLEGASKAEYDEAHPDLLAEVGYKMQGASFDDDERPRPFQERGVQKVARKHHQRLVARRKAEVEESAFEVDQRRREAVAKAQQAAGERSGSQGSSRAAAEAEDEADLATQEELRRQAEARTTGRSARPGADPPVVDTEDDDDDDDTDSDQYDEMRKAALVAEAEARDLDSSGTAEDLRERLREHDAANSGDDDADDDEDEDEEEPPGE